MSFIREAGASLRRGTSLHPLGDGVLAGNSPAWLELAGDVLYASITNDSRIKAYNVADGIAEFLGQITVGTNTGWMATRGKHLIASDANAASIRWINVADPVNMANVGSPVVFDASGNGASARFGLQPRGRLALIGGPETGVTANRAVLLDLGVPGAAPTVGTITTGTTHRGIVAYGEQHFCLVSRDDATVRVITVANPAVPALVSTITTTVSNTTAAIATQGNYIYIGNYGNGTTSGGFEIWDLTDPANPLQAGTLAIVGGVEQMIVRGRYAYLGCRDSLTTLVIDILNPARPLLKASLVQGSFRTPGLAAGNGYIWRTNAVANGSANGTVLTLGLNDDYIDRIAGIEEILATRLGVAAVV